MKKVIFGVVALLAVSFLGGCTLYGNQNGSTNTTPSAPNAVNIQNFAFSPSSLIVTKGTTVTWTNNDSAPHQIKSATVNSEVLNKGATFSFTFNDVGTFDYICSIHPSMTGTIIVQ